YLPELQSIFLGGDSKLSQHDGVPVSKFSLLAFDLASTTLPGPSHHGQLSFAITIMARLPLFAQMFFTLLVFIIAASRTAGSPTDTHPGRESVAIFSSEYFWAINNYFSDEDALPHAKSTLLLLVPTSLLSNQQIVDELHNLKPKLHRLDDAQIDTLFGDFCPVQASPTLAIASPTPTNTSTAAEIYPSTVSEVVHIASAKLLWTCRVALAVAGDALLSIWAGFVWLCGTIIGVLTLVIFLPVVVLLL
ncbi:hypothetical protein HDK77DRAFT_514541, partial [Phyllosticta capitalensis]